MTTFPLESFLGDLEFLINTDSGSADIEGNLQVASFFKERFEKAGLKTTLHRVGTLGHPVVTARTQGSASYDCFFSGHIDTVFPSGTVSERPFRREGNFVYGPGTVDMKAGALLILYLAEYLRKEHPAFSFTIALNSDEEIGSPDSTPLLREFAANCRHIFIFEGQRKQGQFVNERKGIVKFDIEVSGVASHAGTAPHQGVSAILELSEIVVDFSKLQNLERGTSINVGLMEGGSALNVIPAHASAKMELRYTSHREYERILRAISKMETKPHLSGTSVTFTAISHYPPLEITEATEQMMQTLAPLGLSYVKAGGTSDANRLACLGLPILDGCGPGGGFPHSEKEFLDITTIPARFWKMVDIMKRLAEFKR